MLIAALPPIGDLFLIAILLPTGAVLLITALLITSALLLIGVLPPHRRPSIQYHRLGKNAL